MRNVDVFGRYRVPDRDPVAIAGWVILAVAAVLLALCILA